ncbi:MAG: FecR domain-containing protein [Flavobacteriaceae bacterium]|nr:FecR domain-containing protein [Flavobacteriaceae bacterium]
MSDKKIKDLLFKYTNDTATKKELEVLYRYLKSNQNTDEIKETLDHYWKISVDKDFNDKNILSNELFEKIMDQVLLKERVSSKKKKHWPAWSKVAAVSIGLVALAGYSYFRMTQEETLIIPDESITLELEDGSIEVIQDDDSKSLIDEKGNVIGSHYGNKLVYNAHGISEELTYNTLTVPNGKRFELLLSDGSLIHLNSGSSIKYPVDFASSKGMRQVYLSGEAYFKVAKDEMMPFVVNTEGIHVQVLGTEFNVSSYADDSSTHVVLVEGSVQLTKNADPTTDKSPLILQQGDKGQLSKELNAEIFVEKVDIEQYISWRYGNLLFRSSSLENMLKTFERHYNITIVNHDEELNDILFNATFKQEPVENVLRYLDKILGLDYQIKDNTVIIY